MHFYWLGSGPKLRHHGVLLWSEIEIKIGTYAEYYVVYLEKFLFSKIQETSELLMHRIEADRG